MSCLMVEVTSKVWEREDLRRSEWCGNETRRQNDLPDERNITAGIKIISLHTHGLLDDTFSISDYAASNDSMISE
jgi:hypothetical protein